jgi:hypothetical protein
VNAVMNLRGFLKIRGISWVAEEILACHEGLCSMELVMLRGVYKLYKRWHRHNTVRKDCSLERKFNHVKLIKGSITVCVCVCVCVCVLGVGISLLFLVWLLQNQENVQFR